ncbi:MAG TPA: PLP-dependent aminotransferase family protein [Solirubrobacter sp.]|nr:PLP-dependent aminotransferase family protein [Solirubrobacter sp.]
MDRASTTSLLVVVVRGAGALQRQVEDQLRAAIRSGRLVAGERLPASRTLAADLGVSRGVISEAYMQLAAEGWLVVAPRSAPRVAPGGAVAPGGGASPAAPGAATPGPGRAGDAPPAAGASRRAASPPAAGAPLRAAAGASRRAASPPAPVRYDLRPGRPDLAGFPRAEWGRSVAAAIRGAAVADLDYPPIAGAARLREVLAAYRGRVRGTLAGPDDVILTAGAGQAFVALAEALGPVTLAVEDPGHEHIRALLAQRGLRPVPVRVDEQGLVVDDLPPRAGAILLTPAHQFPTGVVLSPERRAALLDWAERRGALIVEDDYDAEYRYDRAPVGALQGLRPDLVAHVGSVSKTLAPALRLGWLIAPPAWRERLLDARGQLDHGLPALEQLALADFIARGAYDRHLRRCARTYGHRRDALLAALRRAVPGATVTGAAAGLHIALHVPGIDEPALVAACRARGLVVDGITPHRVAPGPPGLLISFAAVPDAAAAHVAELIAAGCRT